MTHKIISRLIFLAFNVLVFSTAFCQYADTAATQTIEGDTTTIQQLLVQSKQSIDKDPNKSFEYAQKALSLSTQLSFAKGKSESLRRIGIYYMFHSDYPKALDHILKALRIAEKNNERLLISKCLMNLGGIYYDYGEYTLALSYFARSLKIAKELNDKQSISGCLTNTANVYTDMGNYKSALENYQSALKINVELQDKQGISITMSNIGNVYFYQGNYKAAEDYYIKCLKIKKELDDKPGIIICLNNIGKLYLRINKYDQAIAYCTQSLDLAREIDSMDDIQLASYALASAYKKKGDYKTSLAYFELGSEVKDSIFNDAKNKEIGKLESKYESEKQENQIKLLKKDRALKEEQTHRQLSNRNLIIGGILLVSVLIVTVIQYRNNRQAKKVNQQLIIQNKEIEAKSEALEIANEELDNFIYRSSHDLKAPLTSVLGLINITQIELKEETLKEYLVKMQKSIDKLMLVLQDLSNYSRNSRLAITNEVVDFKLLVAKSIDNFKDLDKYNFIKIDYAVHGNAPFYSDSLRVGILINNLLSNAITHHDLSKNPPVIHIDVTFNEQKAIIKIVDNGNGMPLEIQPKIFDMFYKGSNESQGSGLGLYIVQGVIKKLNDKIFFETIEGKGTTFIAEIPNAKNS